MKKFVFFGCVLFLTGGLIAKNDNPKANDTQITEMTQSQTTFEGISAINNRPIRLVIYEVISRGDGLNPLSQETHRRTRVDSFTEEIVAYHHQMIAPQQHENE